MNMATSYHGGNTSALVGFSLAEDRKYSASMQLLYNGGVMQNSQPVEISEPIIIIIL